MARRKIGDLVQEEVQKMPNSQDLNVAETIDVEVKTKETEAPEKQTQPEPIETVAKSEFEAIVNGLKTELEQVRDHEQALQKQIDGLLSDLQTQDTLVQTLQSQAELANSLKAELDETKQTALKLAEANSQLLQELESLKQSQAEKKAPKSMQKYPAPSTRPAPLQRYGMRGPVEKVTYDEPVWKIDESATTTWLD